MASDLEKTKTLVELAGEYYRLTDGFLIEKPHELLRVADIGEKEKHPHKEHRVYISRKAIKHVVEERRQELSKNHTAVEVLQKICFAVEQIAEAIINFDKYEYEVDEEKYFYTKHYPGNPSIRILYQQKDKALEICSVHFRKQQKEK